MKRLVIESRCFVMTFKCFVTNKNIASNQPNNSDIERLNHKMRYSRGNIVHGTNDILGAKPYLQWTVVFYHNSIHVRWPNPYHVGRLVAFT